MKVCKFCDGKKLVKNGLVRGCQRYKCCDCNRVQIAGDKREKYDNKIKQTAVTMYLNSVGFRSIGRVLNVPSTCSSLDS